jgi:hypothetical protein
VAELVLLMLFLYIQDADLRGELRELLFIAEHGGPYQLQHPHETHDTSANGQKVNTFLPKEVPTERSPCPAAVLQTVSGVRVTCLF